MTQNNNAACPTGACGTSGARSPFALLSPLVRLALGGLMVFSGWMKLGISDLGGLMPQILSPLDFAYSIKGFKMGLSDEVVTLLAFVVPWAELVAGLAVVLGLWTRAGAALIGAMMIAFMAGIASLMVRGLDVNCPCFGAIKLFCSGPLGACHLVRNTGFLLAAVYLMAFGPGPLALEGRRRTG